MEQVVSRTTEEKASRRAPRMASAKPTAALAQFASGLAWSSLSEDERRAAKRHLLDGLGACVAGVDQPVFARTAALLDRIGGSGGVPVVAMPGGHEGVEAVIDKDLASSLLAVGLDADMLVLVTDVDAVYLGFGTPDERAIVANVARYHRKSPPDPSHPNFRDLDKDARSKVRSLAAILRIADALDREHLGKVKSARAEIDGRGRKMNLHVTGEEDRELEEWTVRAKSELLRDVFDLDLVLAGPSSTRPSGKEPIATPAAPSCARRGWSASTSRAQPRPHRSWPPTRVCGWSAPAPARTTASARSCRSAAMRPQTLRCPPTQSPPAAAASTPISPSLTPTCRSTVSPGRAASRRSWSGRPSQTTPTAAGSASWANRPSTC